MIKLKKRVLQQNTLLMMEYVNYYQDIKHSKCLIMETYNIMNKRSIIVEYEFHYGFLLLMIKSLNFRGYDVDVFCIGNFLAYCKIKKIDKKKINLFVC